MAIEGVASVGDRNGVWPQRKLKMAAKAYAYGVAGGIIGGSEALAGINVIMAGSYARQQYAP
jgi:hypothetical protein